MSNNKLEKLKKLLEVANDGLSKTEFLESFKKVIDQVLKIETKVLEKINKAIDELRGSQDTSLQATQGDLKALGDKLEQSINKALKEQADSLDFIRDKVRRIKDFTNGKDGIDGQNGADGKDADENKIIQEVLKQVKMPEMNKTELETIKKELESFREQRTRFGGGGTSYLGIKQHFIDDETPLGVINKTNTDFVLASTPNPTNSLKVYLDGQRMRITEDYTLSGRTITFLSAPLTNSVLLVDYRK